METTDRQKRVSMFLVMLCAAMWSIAGIFIKLIPWNSMVIASLRSLLAGLVAFTYTRIAHIPLVFNKKSLLAGVALCSTMTLFVVANKLTTAANAIVLQFTAPIFIVVFSTIFLRKKSGKADVIAVGLTMVGISLFFFDQLTPGHLLGNCIALGAGMSFACYYMSLGSCGLAERMSTIVTANALTFLIGLPFLFFTKPVFSATPVLCIILLGIVQLGIPYVMLGKGSEHCPPLACSLLGALEPLLNPVWVFLFDGERPGVFALVGGTVVIVTITVWCIYNNKKEHSEANATCLTN